MQVDTTRLAARFWARVNKTDTCWLWTGRIDEAGYGLLDVVDPNGRAKGRPQKAQRVSWYLHTGVWPDRDVLHRCDNPPCVRFDGHLWLGTNDDNIADKVAKGRQYRGGRHHHAKLTDEQVRAIRRRAAGGMMQKDLAVEYGVSPSTICDILAKRVWKHVPTRP